LYLVANVKLSCQLRAIRAIVLILSPQSVFSEAMYDTYRRMVGESVFYKHQIYRYKAKEMECTSQVLKEARAMMANLKKERHKDKAKIQELSEIIHKQNFLLQHNDQYMLELENQLEAIAVPPPERAIPGPAGGEEAEDIQGESRIESGPESP
jgi:uncharacterized protein YcgL (UPF0745 family)